MPRVEAKDKVGGTSSYVDDVKLPGMIYGKTIRSKIPRGRIMSIDFSPSISWQDFTIVMANDIPGRNVIALIENDQLCLADQMIAHSQEPVLLIAHPNPSKLEEAAAAISIKCEALPALLTMEEALSSKEKIWGDDNIVKKICIKKGDTNSFFSQSSGSVHILEGEYRTGAQEHLYIEPNGVIADWSADGTLTVQGSLQCPYYVQKAICQLFGISEANARVIQLETGGGFGGKEEYPSMLACHAALLAKKAKRPVKMVYDRSEDMTATTKRHPSHTRIKTAISPEGKLLAADIRFHLDAGAYATLSSVVLSRGAIHALGPYSCDHVFIEALAIATNTPPNGAFRGFGAPQSIFAMERHLDRIAKSLGRSPIEVRQRNLVQPGDSLATGQVLREDPELVGLLGDALRETDFARKEVSFAAENRKNALVKRGIGVATFMHGCGFTGSGEKNLRSVAGIELTKDGVIRVLAASTEIGQGTNTVFAQIAADALGVFPDSISVARPDTKEVPNSGPTVASRTVMVVGKLVENAAIALKQMIVQKTGIKEPYTPSEFLAACSSYLRDHEPPVCYSQYVQPAHIEWNDATYQGDAYGTFGWGAYVAEVSVDMLTFEVTVDDFFAIQDIGRVVNPALAEGQVQGGVTQALGWALSEKVVWADGVMKNAQMTNYIIPTSLDAPHIKVKFRQKPHFLGPQGAKGLGELPMDGPAPAIMNAIAAATGWDVCSIPCLPEDLLEQHLRGSVDG